MILRKRRCMKLLIYILGVCAITELAIQNISQNNLSTKIHRIVSDKYVCDEDHLGECDELYDEPNEQVPPEMQEEEVSHNGKRHTVKNRGNKMLDKISFGEHFNANYFNNTFPPRSLKELYLTLQEAHDIMRPIIQEIEDIRTVILSTRQLWEKPRKPSLVLLSNNEYFTRKLNRNSLDVLDGPGMTSSPKPRIRTINIWSTKAQLKRIFKPEFFVDYASNNCSSIERRTVYEHKMARRLFNSTCNTNVSKAWETKPFQSNSFKIGQPEDYKTNNTHLMVGYIHIIKNGAVDLNGDVSVGRLKIVIRRCSMVRSTTIPHPSTKQVFNEVFTIAQFWGSGFYHGTVEDFTRIAPYVGFLQKHKKIKIHVKTKTGFIKAFLEHLGISPGRMVSGSVGARILYLPAGTPCGRSAIFPTYLLSMEFRSRMASPVQPRTSIVIIKRTTKRRFRHHNKILIMLQSVATERPELKLKVEVYPDNPVPGLKETLAMMNRAFIVIAPHGAGESNLLFSEPGTVMIEGLCKSGGSKAILCYRNLAQVLGHRYYGILSKQSCYTATPDTIETPLRQIMNYYFK